VPNKSYTVRIPQNAPGITSDQVAGWLDAYLAAGGELTIDPGAGERSLRLSLDREKVEQSAREAGEPEAVLLRRLIASHVTVPQEQREVAEQEARPKPLVLKGAGKLRPDQVRPLVRAVEAGQSFLIRKTFGVEHISEAADAARFTEEEREHLSIAATEVINRRAPSVVVENIDIISLATTVIAIEAEKIDRVHAIAERMRQKQAQPEPVPAEQGEVKPQ
jgi:hypothetical protein